jgi:hypothetical protein
MAFYHRQLRSDELRLLTLLPGKPKGEIQCNLQIVPLDNLPAFDALSYAWGDPNVTEPIIVQNTPHQATANLVMALRALRGTKKRRLLWVDALCINQGDLDEKNMQIPLMAKIYSVATHVIAWLGPSTPEIELFSQWVQTYFEKPYNISSVSRRMLDAASLFLDRLQEKKLVKGLKVIQGYCQLLQAPYWRRMWTYQEYQLASVKPVCICGNIVYHPTILFTLWQLVWNKIFSSMDRFRVGHQSREYLHLDKPAWMEYLKVVELLSGVNFIQLEHGGARHGSMTLALFVTAGRKCSDPLDKFYSLYGLCPAIQAVNPPDYHKTPETVRRETTAYIISHEKIGLVYISFGMRDAALDDESVPSWVPEFDQSSGPKSRHCYPSISSYDRPDLISGKDSGDSAERFLIKHGSGFDNLGNAPAAVIDDTLTILGLPARDLGPCQVTLRFGEQYDEVLDDIRLLLRAGPNSPKYDAAGRVPRERIARLCVSSQASSSLCSDTELLAAFDRLFPGEEQERSHRRPRNDPTVVSEGAVRKLRGKTLFTTEGGLLGIGVSAINDGDILILAPEVEFPLLLRPKDRVSTDGVRGQHRLVGTAYVDGVMMPLSLDPDVDAEVSQLEVKVFNVW